MTNRLTPESPSPPPTAPGHRVPPAPSARRQRRGTLWTLVPLLTFGFGTPFSFWYVAVRVRSRALSAAAAGYSALWLLLFIAWVALDDDPNSAIGWPDVTIWLTTPVLMLGGFTHALVVRRRIFARLEAAVASSDELDNEEAVDAARRRRALRAEGRELAARDPGLAHELRIGRPDLHRTYDDGGLVDVNHASPAALATLPGITPELTERIVRVREERGGFVSPEELMVFADLPPTLAATIADRTVYLP